jgi:hypothetical protein
MDNPNKTDASLDDLRAHYPIGSYFRTIVGDRVQVVKYSEIVETGYYRLSVRYPSGMRVRIFPFNGHTREDGTLIEMAKPADVCEQDTMSL